MDRTPKLFALKIFPLIQLFKEESQKTSVQTTMRKKDQVKTRNIFKSYIIGNKKRNLFCFKQLPWL